MAKAHNPAFPTLRTGAVSGVNRRNTRGYGILVSTYLSDGQVTRLVAKPGAMVGTPCLLMGYPWVPTRSEVGPYHNGPVT